MSLRRADKVLWVARFGIIAALLVAFRFAAGALPQDAATIDIVVTDAESGKPINQAHLTLLFTEPGNKFRLKRARPTSYTAKTNIQGRCKFSDIPKGTIRLMVTANDHEAFGKDFDVEQDHEVLDVKMKKPQPLI